MSDLELRREILDPATGELVPANDPAQLAAFLGRMRFLAGQLREVQREISLAFGDLAAVHATGTFTLEDGTKVTVGSATKIEYDLEALEDELRAAGMPESVLDEVIETKVTREVKASRLKRAASRNPTYAAIIERNSRTVEQTPRVSLPPEPIRRSAKRTEGADH